jgi:hypothetical protein
MHLKLTVSTRDANGNQIKTTKLSGHKITMLTFTFDLVENYENSAGCLTDVRCLVKASKKPEKVFFKFAASETGPGTETCKERILRFGRNIARDDVTKWVNKGFGVIGKSERVSPTDYDEHSFWARGDGS